MKIIKVRHAEFVKKFIVKEQLKDLPQLLAVIEQITGLPQTNIALTFKDAEGDVIEIEDKHDLDYFYAQLTANTCSIDVNERQNDKLEQFSLDLSDQDLIFHQSQSKSLKETDEKIPEENPLQIQKVEDKKNELPSNSVMIEIHT